MARTSTANKWGSGWIRKEKRIEVYNRDGWKCHYCNKTVEVGTTDRSVLATLDHLDGNHSNNKVSNLVTCCYSCNSSKQDFDMTGVYKGGLATLVIVYAMIS